MSEDIYRKEISPRIKAFSWPGGHILRFIWESFDWLGRLGGRLWLLGWDLCCDHCQYYSKSEFRRRCTEMKSHKFKVRNFKFKLRMKGWSKSCSPLIDRLIGHLIILVIGPRLVTCLVKLQIRPIQRADLAFHRLSWSLLVHAQTTGLQKVALNSNASPNVHDARRWSVLHQQYEWTGTQTGAGDWWSADQWNAQTRARCIEALRSQTKLRVSHFHYLAYYFNVIFSEWNPGMVW